MEKSKVYFTKEITPESLIRIYKALGVELKGKVGVKISTGEPGGHNYLHPELIGDLVHLLKWHHHRVLHRLWRPPPGSGGALESHRGTRLQSHGPLRHHGRA